MAYGVYIYAGFDAGNEKMWNTEKSQQFDLSVGQSIVVRLRLQEPRERHTRLVIQLVDDGHAVETSYSKWLEEWR